MALTQIILTVATEALKTSTDPTDFSWAKITQRGGIPDPTNPPLAANLYLSTIYKGDIITWVGVPDSAGDPSVAKPIINITAINFGKSNIHAAFSDPILITDPNLGGSTITMTALQDFEALGDLAYTIDFVISYKFRTIDPKIKIIPPAPAPTSGS